MKTRTCQVLNVQVLPPISLSITTMHYDKTSEEKLQQPPQGTVRKLEPRHTNLTLAERQKRLLPYINFYISEQLNQPHNSADERYQILAPTKINSYQPTETKYSELIGTTYQPNKVYDTTQLVYQPKTKFTPFLESNALPGPFVPMVRSQPQKIKISYTPIEQIEKVPNYSAIYEKLSQLKLQQNALNGQIAYKDTPSSSPQYFIARNPHVNFIPVQEYQQEQPEYAQLQPLKTYLHSYTPTSIELPSQENVKYAHQIYGGREQIPIKISQPTDHKQEQIQEQIMIAPEPITVTQLKEPVTMQQFKEPLKESMAVTEYKEPITVTQYKEPITVTQYKEPITVTQYKEPITVTQYKEPITVTRYKEPITVTQYKEPITVTQYKEPITVTQYKEPIPVTQYKDPFVVTHIKEPIRLTQINNPKLYEEQTVVPQQTVRLRPHSNYAPVLAINPQQQYLVQEQKQYHTQNHKQYLQEVVPTTKQIILIPQKILPQKQYEEVPKDGPLKIAKPIIILQPTTPQTKPYSAEPVITQTYQPVPVHHRVPDVMPAPAPEIQTENPNSLSHILKKLQDSNALPQTLTPENIDNSIKTLVHILSSLKKQQKLQRPIVVTDEEADYEEELDNETEVGLGGSNDEVPGTVTEFFPAHTPEGGTPGKPGVDYPALATIPHTNFNCKMQRYKGFFADPDTHCQVWHYCDLNGGQASFLCPNGTIFSQVALTCDWWFNVKCSTTTQLYVLNERLYKYIIPLTPKFPEDYAGPLVDRYLALKFQEMEEKMKKEKSEKKTKEDKNDEVDELQLLEDKNTERHTTPPMEQEDGDDEE